MTITAPNEPTSPPTDPRVARLLRQVAEPPHERNPAMFRPDGTIVIAFPTESRTLRRPTLGEFKRFRSLMDAVVEHTSSRPDDVDDPSVLEQWRDDGDLLALTFWLDVVTTLDTSTSKEPEPDAFPPFLFYGYNVIGDTIDHWRYVPSGPGGG